MKLGFKSIPSSQSGLDFSNLLDETSIKSPFNYINVYLGGGVAIGDVNNDGLQDVYLTANMSSSKLFLNKGNMEFEDITTASGTSTEGWASAVTMADVNNDGWIDIYVCRSYYNEPEIRANLLFINNQDGTFTEKASQLGVNDGNYSVASSFFDFDKDGDLDLIVGNHPRYRLVPLMTHYNYWKNPVPEFSNRLYRNDGDQFTEITEEAGILSYGFTLGICTSDFTNDGYPDIWITVDHDEPDLIFKNNKDGTFTNIIDSAIRQSSLSSMGIDAGDVNHDKLPDIFVAEMLSEDHYREKVNMSMQSVNRFNYLTDTLKYKYYQMHNFLYLNNGNNTFSDISQLAGVSKSDWTWASFFLDFDNDGWQDIYCTNGLFRDVFNKDRRNLLDSIMASLEGDMQKMNQVAEEYSRTSTQTKIKNYLFRNKGNLEFEKYADQAGLIEKTISTGAAYGDLDNDGDLDMVINNLGEQCLLYQNMSQGNNYLSFEFLSNNDINPLGTKVYIYTGNDMQSRELLTTRGFQSSCQPRVHFGLGDISQIEKVEIIWPDDSYQVLKNPEVNNLITVDYKDSKDQYNYSIEKKVLCEVLSAETLGIDYIHKENYFNDYDIQVLLPHKMSEYGPFTSVGDVNGDGLDDIYIGSPQGQASTLYLQNESGRFVNSLQPAFEAHKNFEDSQSNFVDVDGDDDIDLIVGSTSYELPIDSKYYLSRIYTNDGKGSFSYDQDQLKDFYSSTSCVKAADFDKDGDVDLFIGGRLNPQKYPLPGQSGLFVNDGNGNYTNAIQDIAADLEEVGMVRDAIWHDINADDQLDLIVVGEWMPVSVWLQDEGKFERRDDIVSSKPLTGWWNHIEIKDMDGDGMEDILLGNLGLNYKYKASEDKPFMVYTKDFDNSGTHDIVLGTYYGDVVYPVRGKSCSSEQIPDLGKEFKSFEEFALADIEDVYGEKLDEAEKYEVVEFGSLILFKNGDGSYTPKLLPNLAQKSPVNDMVVMDFDGNDLPDLLVAGNLYQSEIETGRADSGTGVILINQGDRNFKALSVNESGLYLPEDVKSLEKISINNQPYILVGNNKGRCQLVKFN